MLTQSVPVKKLALDLHNYRAMPQKNEEEETEVLATLDPNYFWGLAKSLLDNGFMPMETIVVLKRSPKEWIVREGNRRVAVLKLALGLLKGTKLDMPTEIRGLIDGLSADWKESNKEVPCCVFELAEEKVVTLIVGRTHAKSDKASRLDWSSTPRARYDRDVSSKKVPELDLLEKYLVDGSNITASQRARWGSDYHLSVLEAAIPRLASRLGEKSPADLVKSYPAIADRAALEKLLYAIGMKVFGFDELRSTTEDILLTRFGIPALPTTSSTSTTTTGGSGSSTGAGTTTAGNKSQGTTTTSKSTTGTKQKAYALDDPKSVMRNLKAFAPVGNNRDKVVSLRDEALHLKLQHHPMSFCFLLRSMFEISAKAYYDDHKKSGQITLVDSKGKDRKLAAILKDVCKHLQTNSSDPKAKSRWHGALVELDKPTSVLSVTSMNQLVHSQSFSLKATDISAMFNRVFPLLDAMNS